MQSKNVFMDEVSLYRKYRPHNFENLVGQDHIKVTLVNALRSNKLSHAYLFTGPRGTGKTSTARLLAKAITCLGLKDGHEPCDECQFCKDINEGRLIDLIEIDAASNRGIDEVRDLKEKINFAPTRAKCKIYIVDEVHMMTKEAFNALLKTLEEPPSHTYFILATTEVHKIPATIISRCQRFDFRRIGTKTLMTRLSYIAQKEKIEADDLALEAISKYVDGGLRDGIGLLQQITLDGKLLYQNVQEILGLSNKNFMEQLFSHLVANDCTAALQLIEDLHTSGSDLKQFIHEFIDILREKMLESVREDERHLTGRLITMIKTFQVAHQGLEVSIPQLSLEIAVIELTRGVENVYDAVVVEPKASEVAKPKVEEIKPADAETRLHKTIEVPEEKIEIANFILPIVKEKWPRIVERLKIPTLRMSLRGAKPMEVKGSDLIVEFETNFHKDKVMEHENRVTLEEMLQEFFGRAVRVVAVVKELEIKEVVEEEAACVGVAPESDNGRGKKTVNEALEIFGGEVVE